MLTKKCIFLSFLTTSFIKPLENGYNLYPSTLPREDLETLHFNLHNQRFLFWEVCHVIYNQHEIKSAFVKFLRITLDKWKLPHWVRWVSLYQVRLGWGTWKAVWETLNKIVRIWFTYTKKRCFPLLSERLDLETWKLYSLWLFRASFKPRDSWLLECMGF